MKIGKATLAILLASFLGASAMAGPPPCKGKNKNDPGCGDPPTPPPSEGQDYTVTIAFAGAVTTLNFLDMDISCDAGSCQMKSSAGFEFLMPESYWSQWTDEEAVACFGQPGPEGNVTVDARGFSMRDHHGGADNEWHMSFDYRASFIGTDRRWDHHLHAGGFCDEAGGCPNNPPPAEVANVFDGVLDRTQIATRKRKPKGTPCTCQEIWPPGCDVLPFSVTVKEQ